MDKNVAHALVQMYLFFEFSDEKLIDPDHAVKMTETISFILKGSNKFTLNWLRNTFDEIADNYNQKDSEYIKDIFDNMGLGDNI